MERKGLLGGLAGVSLSSTLYGLILAWSHSPLLALYGFFAGVAVFLLAFKAWTGKRRMTYVIAGIIPVLPLIWLGLPWSIALAVAEAFLLFVGLVGSGTLLIVFSGAAVGGYGGFLALAGGSGALLGFIPLLYHLVSIGSATIRVTGDKSYAGITVLAAIMLLLVTYTIDWTMTVPVVADLVSRVVERLPGPWRGLSLRAYGIVETLRIILVLLALALLAPA